MTNAPKVDPVTLLDLVPGYAGDLGHGELLEGMAFDAVDVSGLDLTGLTARECAFSEPRLTETILRGATFAVCTFDRLDAPILSAPRSGFADVEIAHSRIGSGELYEATLERVRFTDCKIGYLNLRGSALTDVLFENCTIDELDLGGATGSRIALVGTQVESLDLTKGRFVNVDLRGAELHVIAGLDGIAGVTLSELQVSLMADMFARHLGVRID